MNDLSKFPPIAATTLLTTGEPIFVKPGVTGYWKANPKLDPDKFNAAHDIVPEVVEAMVIGSMFGWDVPGAKYPEESNA